MSATNWIGLGAMLCTLLAVGWQIRRDSRKDRAEQIAAAVQAARDSARLEERVRRLEQPGDDDE